MTDQLTFTKYFQKDLPGLGSDAPGKINKSSSWLNPISLSLALLPPRNDILTLPKTEDNAHHPHSPTTNHLNSWTKLSVSVLDNTSIVNHALIKNIVPLTMWLTVISCMLASTPHFVLIKTADNSACRTTTNTAANSWFEFMPDVRGNDPACLTSQLLTLMTISDVFQYKFVKSWLFLLST